MKKWENELYRAFSKEGVQMARKTKKTPQKQKGNPPEEMFNISSHNRNASQNMLRFHLKKK
jgi:hypothetical protein